MGLFHQYIASHIATITDKLTAIQFFEIDDYAHVIAELDNLIKTVEKHTIPIKNLPLLFKPDRKQTKALQNLFGLLVDVEDPDDPYGYCFVAADNEEYRTKYLSLIEQEKQRLTKFSLAQKQEHIDTQNKARQQIAENQKKIASSKAKHQHEQPDNELIKQVKEFNANCLLDSGEISLSKGAAQIALCLKARQAINQYEEMINYKNNKSDLVASANYAHDYETTICRMESAFKQDVEIIFNSINLSSSYLPGLESTYVYLVNINYLFNSGSIKVEAFKNLYDVQMRIHMIENCCDVVSFLNLCDEDTCYVYIKARQILSAYACLRETQDSPAAQHDQTQNTTRLLTQEYLQLTQDKLNKNESPDVCLHEIAVTLNQYCDIIKYISLPNDIKFYQLIDVDLGVLYNLAKYAESIPHNKLPFTVDVFLRLPNTLQEAIINQMHNLDKQCKALKITFDQLISIPAANLEVILTNPDKTAKLASINYLLIDLAKLLHEVNPKQLRKISDIYESTAAISFSNQNQPNTKLLLQILENFKIHVICLIGRIKTTSDILYLKRLINEEAAKLLIEIQKLNMHFYQSRILYDAIFYVLHRFAKQYIKNYTSIEPHNIVDLNFALDEIPVWFTQPLANEILVHIKELKLSLEDIIIKLPKDMPREFKNIREAIALIKSPCNHEIEPLQLQDNAIAALHRRVRRTFNDAAKAKPRLQHLQLFKAIITANIHESLIKVKGEDWKSLANSWTIEVEKEGPTTDYDIWSNRTGIDENNEEISIGACFHNFVNDMLAFKLALKTAVFEANHVNKFSSIGEDELFKAIEQENLDAVDAALANGSNAVGYNLKGSSYIACAIATNNRQIIQRVLNKLLMNTEAILKAFVQSCFITEIKTREKASSSIIVQFEKSKSNFSFENLNRTYNGHTLLQHAIISNRPEIVTALLIRGADPELTIYSCKTALGLAKEHNMYSAITDILVVAKYFRENILELQPKNETQLRSSPIRIC